MTTVGFRDGTRKMRKKMPKKQAPPEPKHSKQFEAIREQIASIDETILLADGYEEALIGFVEGWIPAKGGGASPSVVALYDREKCIEILVKRDGMSYDEAVEFFEFNTTGAYAGEKTPMYATILRRDSKMVKKSRK